MGTQQKGYVIGTRGSRLALWQAEYISDRLADEGIETRLEIIRTKGDLDQSTPLPKIGDKGLFTAELDAALIGGQIDLAVHSLKDLPTVLPPELTLAAVPERASPWDALVARSSDVDSLSALPNRAVVGSSSLRRAAQLLSLRPDLRINSLRGNVETRLRKLEEGQYDAIILAEAGLERLGFSDRISFLFTRDELTPAVSQGALGVVCASSRNDLAKQLYTALNNEPTEFAVTAERAFLRRLEGGCQVPVGGYATMLQGGGFRLHGVVSSIDGTESYRDTVDFEPAHAAAAGVQLAESLLERGAGDILASIRSVPTTP